MSSPDLSWVVIALLSIAILCGLFLVGMAWSWLHLEAEGEETTTFGAIRPGHRKPADWDRIYHLVASVWDRVFEWIGRRWQWPGSSVR